MFATITENGKIYTNQTGRFPVTSSWGNQYISVLYDYNTNAILTEPLNSHRNRNTQGIHKITCLLDKKGFWPETHWLDNEASEALKRFNDNQQVTFQLVSPHMHRQNAAERAIRAWKNHLVVGLCSTETHFPMHLWDHLLQQATITLNLLRPS